MERVCDQYWQLLLSDYLTGVDAPLHPVRDLNVFKPHMDYCGRVRRFVPYKDKVRKCVIFDEFVRTGAIRYEEKYRMAVPNREAMTISISKYNRPQPEIDEKVFEIAKDWTEKHFRPYMGNSKTVSHDIARRDLDRQTSAGYPWSLFWRNKGQFLDSEEAPKIEQMFWDNLTAEVPFEAFWTASLKHELRPVEKLKENKIRTFTASATEATVAATRLFLEMNERFYESNNKTWSFVGCSKYNLGFDRLYRRLNKHPNAFELDETAFDSSLFRAAMEGVRDLRFKFLHASCKTPDNKKRIDELYRQIIHSLIVLDDGTVFQKHTGNPSGSANTIVDNTLILFMLFAYAYILLALKHCPEMATYEHFMEFVEAALNGDDNTFTVSQRIINWFNAKNVAEEWSKVGVITKSPCFEPRKLEECEFLSHRFVRYKKMWIPVPEREKALCSLMWGQEFDDVRFTLLRAYALRIETWGDVQARRDIQNFIDHIERVYKDELVGEIPDTQLTMKIIRSVWKTDAEIERLYTLPPVLEKSAKGQAKYRYPRNRRDIGAIISLANRYGLLADWDEDDHQVDDHRVIALAQSEMVTQNCTNHLMPKGKGNKKKGGNPSKQEMARRHQQSQRDKAQAAKKKNHAHKPKKQHHSNKDVTTRTYNAPIATGSTQEIKRGSHSRPHVHSTFIATFTTGTDGKFTEAKTLALNPAQQDTDPWGFVIAGRFQKYGRKGKAPPFTIRVEPRVATTSDGETFIQINYDAQQPAPTSSTQLLNGYRANRAAAWLPNKCVADGSEFSQKKLYCRMGAKPSGTDIREYDFGNVYIFYEGFTLAKTFDIWLDIDLMLYDPIIPDVEMPSIADFSHTQFLSDGTDFKGGLESGAGGIPYGVQSEFKEGKDFLVDFEHTGYFLVTYSFERAAGVVTWTSAGAPPTPSAGSELVNTSFGGGAGYIATFTATTVVMSFVFKSNFNNGSVAIQSPACAAGTSTGAVCNLWISFLGYLNNNPSPPEISRKTTGGKKEKKDRTQISESKIIDSIVNDKRLLERLRALLLSGAVLTAKEPSSDDEDSLAPLGQALITPKPSSSDEKKSAVVGGKGGKSK